MSGVVTSDGLAIDWVYSHLYWTDTGTDTISVTDLTGQGTVVLFQDQLEEPCSSSLQGVHTTLCYIVIIPVYLFYAYSEDVSDRAIVW